jgi:hypothetical protein
MDVSVGTRDANIILPTTHIVRGVTVTCSSFPIRWRNRHPEFEMSIGNTTENAILDLIFSATTWANYAINATASPETIHTADPLDAGTQSTSEAAYTSYARVNVARSTGWNAASSGSVSPAAAITFPASGASGTTITHFSTGKSGGGATAILFSGTVTPNIAIGASGITPQLTTASTITLD